MHEIVRAELAGTNTLRLHFENGVNGLVNIRDLVPFSGVFAPLSDPEFFAQVRVDPELGSVCWPNGADLDPLVLYGLVTGTPALNE